MLIKRIFCIQFEVYLFPYLLHKIINHSLGITNWPIHWKRYLLDINLATYKQYYKRRRANNIKIIKKAKNSHSLCLLRNCNKKPIHETPKYFDEGTWLSNSFPNVPVWQPHISFLLCYLLQILFFNIFWNTVIQYVSSNNTCVR